MKVLVLATWIVSVLLGLVGVFSVDFPYPYSTLVGIVYIAITGYVCVATLIELDKH